MNANQINVSLTWKGPKSICTCSHTGDGSDTEHGPLSGHGRCLVPGCGCGQFTWSRFTPEYEAAHKKARGE